MSIIFDDELSVTEHVISIIRTCFCQMRLFRFIRQSLMVVHAFISSKMDYCNFLLYGANRRRKISIWCHHSGHSEVASSFECCCSLELWNEATKDHFTPAMRNELHWLPVSQCVMYVIVLILYKCLPGNGPACITDYSIALTVTNSHQFQSTKFQTEIISEHKISG